MSCKNVGRQDTEEEWLVAVRRRYDEILNSDSWQKQKTRPRSHLWTRDGGAKTPCLGGQLKYRTPPTDPSFFPPGLSSLMPNQRPASQKNTAVWFKRKGSLNNVLNKLRNFPWIPESIVAADLEQSWFSHRTWRRRSSDRPPAPSPRGAPQGPRTWSCSPTEFDCGYLGRGQRLTGTSFALNWAGFRREVSGWKRERLKSDLQEPARLGRLKRRRPAAPLFLDSAGRGAFEVWEADAALAEDEAERSVRAESPAKRTMRTATGRHL